MRYLQHESGEATTLKNAQVLGGDSPLAFDEDGRAGPIEDVKAEKVSAMHKYVHLGRRARGSSDDEDDGGEAFDAETFVDRTPMDDVVDDLESGDYDEHLDAIETAADRQGVLDAIEERQE